MIITSEAAGGQASTFCKCSKKEGHICVRWILLDLILKRGRYPSAGYFLL